jgi:hypothetical protein
MFGERGWAMSNVISFSTSPLAPFLGEWKLDPLSVSRNKVMKGRLGSEGFKKLWKCTSMDERARCLAEDPELANRYQFVLGLGRERILVLTPKAITFMNAQSGTIPAKVTVLAVVKITVEGKKVVVHTIDTRPELLGRRMAYVFRMNKQWLLVSERYFGREAHLFPRSPIHRYHRSA